MLAGGASLGAMQAGMFDVLYEREAAPDLIVGTSAGALNAAFIASRPQTVATDEELATVQLAMPALSLANCETLAVGETRPGFVLACTWRSTRIQGWTYTLRPFTIHCAE